MDSTSGTQDESGLGGARLAVVGAGAMGEAIIAGLLRAGLVAPERIVASDPREARVAELHERHGLTAVTDNRRAVDGADVIVLAVKPHVVAVTCHELRAVVPPGALVLSIAAGVRMAALVRGLGHQAVVRAMPNTPAQIGQGMTVWTASADVTGAQRARARVVLATLGDELFVDAEEALDMATAVSGSGPAYVFLMMEALVDAAVRLGWGRPEAERLVSQTFLGAAAHARESPLPLAALRHQVTSPGGTTAHALFELESGGLRAVLARAVDAAYRRSVALGQPADEDAPPPPARPTHKAD